jgi:predicted ATPase
VKLIRARVTNYRSARDTGWFDVEQGKTILVGPNEAGKTVTLRALQTINPPADEGVLKALQDYPRSDYSQIDQGKVKLAETVVADAVFSIEDSLREELGEIDPAFAGILEVQVTRYLDNHRAVRLGVGANVKWADIEKDLDRLKAHLIRQGAPDGIVQKVDTLRPADEVYISTTANALVVWTQEAAAHMDKQHEPMLERVAVAGRRPANYKAARALVEKRLPTLVYYSSFFAVRPRIHLQQLANKVATSTLDEEYDFGNLCLLKLLGFDAAELAQQGRVGDVNERTPEATATSVRDQLDARQYRLNAAAVELTKLVRRVWGADDFRLNFRADGDYLKVVVEDEEGVEIELDQRSHGLVWLISFYIVFKSQALDELSNAILLLDEPGMSLHALKQQEFRRTVSLLAEENQTIYTTHSPFMVGTDELDLVRVVEMKDRATGTKVHSGIVADDPASLYPLQAALGYNLAQSLFVQQRNLICEGLSDLWYLEGVSQLMKAAGKPALDERIATVPAGGASKVVYFATLLRSQELQVAALLDSDAAGESAATQDDFVRLMPRRAIHRAKDFYTGQATHPETEDLLRETLITIAKTGPGWDVATTAQAQPTRGIGDIFAAEVPSFSKYKLAKAFVSWSSTHTVADLAEQERADWQKLITAINASLE